MKINSDGELQLDVNLALKQVVEAPTPNAEYFTLHFKPDGNLYTKNSAGVEKLIGYDGGGGEVGSGPFTVEYSNAITLNALANKLYLLEDTTTVNLPANPVNGTIVGISDYKSQFETTPVTIIPNTGDTIAQLPELLVNTDNACIQLAYWNNNWAILNSESFYELTGNAQASPPPTGSGLSYLIETLNTAAPYTVSNNTVSLVATDTASTHMAINLSPKGQGSFYLGPTADNTNTGGELRGARSVDLQLFRFNPDQVVSGPSSFAAGIANILPGEASIALGENNEVTGYNCVAIGSYNVNTASYGGYILGEQGSVTQDYSCVLQGGKDKGRAGALIYNGGSGNGGPQVSHFIQNGYSDFFNPLETLTSTNSGLVTDSMFCILEDNNVYAIEATVLGVSNLQNMKHFSVNCLVKRLTGPGTVAFVGTPNIQTLNATANTSGWTVSAILDTARGAFTLQVNTTGLPSNGSEAVRWVANIKTLEMVALF